MEDQQKPDAEPKRTVTDLTNSDAILTISSLCRDWAVMKRELDSNVLSKDLAREKNKAMNSGIRLAHLTYQACGRLEDRKLAPQLIKRLLGAPILEEAKQHESEEEENAPEIKKVGNW